MVFVCVCGNHIFSDGLCLCGCVYRALSGDATIADMIGISHLHREGNKGRVVVAVVDVHHVDQGATGRTVVVDVVQQRTGVCGGAAHQLVEPVRVHETQQWRRVGCCL